MSLGQRGPSMGRVMRAYDRASVLALNRPNPVEVEEAQQMELAWNDSVKAYEKELKQQRKTRKREAKRQKEEKKRVARSQPPSVPGYYGPPVSKFSRTSPPLYYPSVVRPSTSGGAGVNLPPPPATAPKPPSDVAYLLETNPDPEELLQSAAAIVINEADPVDYFEVAKFVAAVYVSQSPDTAPMIAMVKQFNMLSGREDGWRYLIAIAQAVAETLPVFLAQLKVAKDSKAAVLQKDVDAFLQSAEPYLAAYKKWLQDASVPGSAGGSTGGGGGGAAGAGSGPQAQKQPILGPALPANAQEPPGAMVADDVLQEKNNVAKVGAASSRIRDGTAVSVDYLLVSAALIDGVYAALEASTNANRMKNDFGWYRLSLSQIGWPYLVTLARSTAEHFDQFLAVALGTDNEQRVAAAKLIDQVKVPLEAYRVWLRNAYNKEYGRF